MSSSFFAPNQINITNVLVIKSTNSFSTTNLLQELYSSFSFTTELIVYISKSTNTNWRDFSSPNFSVAHAVNEVINHTIAIIHRLLQSSRNLCRNIFLSSHSSNHVVNSLGSIRSKDASLVVVRLGIVHTITNIMCLMWEILHFGQHL